jgi:predicted  nucleic acid-binding Zn-ribbon protein
MPAIKKQPKKVSKSDNTSENLNKAVTFILDELDALKDKVDKIAGRMGL